MSITRPPPPLLGGGKNKKKRRMKMKNSIIFEKEKGRLQITGSLVADRFGKITIRDGKGKERTTEKPYYQYSLLAPFNEEIAKVIRDAYFADAESQFIPKWVKGEDTPDEKGNIFYNFKSLFEIKYFCDGELISRDDLIEKARGSIVGSNVTASVTCKDGALYISAIRIDELHAVSISDYFS